MKKVSVTACALALCLVFDGLAMPTMDEVKRAEPSVQKLLASEKVALKAGRKTRAEVAAAAMKLVEEADTEAAKLLLMKGAFVLYVKDGNLEKAVETMNALEASIADMPSQCITNMIETSLLGLPNKDDASNRLYRLFSCSAKADGGNRRTVQSIIDGMIKVPGRDYWLSATEVTQGQWEAVMGYNLSKHKGANLPVENVSRDECAIFLEKLNETKEVLLTRFEFGLPTLPEWQYAAQAGGPNLDCWIKPGVAGDVQDMAWVAENSSNQTHVVATKAPNAFGFYDMLGNVWEWMNCEQENVGCRHGGSFRDPTADCTIKKGYHNPRHRQSDVFGLRVAAYIRSAVEVCPDEK